MKPITHFLLASFAITAGVELGGIGVFAANRRYEEAIQEYQKQNRYANALPEELDRLYRKEHGPGTGMAVGLLHGIMGIPRTMLSFAFILSNNQFRTSLYVTEDPALAHHNNGLAYHGGFIVGLLMFVALLALALPVARGDDGEEERETVRGQGAGMRDEG